MRNNAERCEREASAQRMLGPRVEANYDKEANEITLEIR